MQYVASFEVLVYCVTSIHGFNIPSPHVGSVCEDLVPYVICSQVTLGIDVALT